MSNKYRCDKCRFWEPWKPEDHKPHPNDIEGKCRRFPPVLSDAGVADCVNADESEAAEVPNNMYVWFQPITSGDDWCGEFKQVEVE